MKVALYKVCSLLFHGEQGFLFLNLCWLQCIPVVASFHSGKNAVVDEVLRPFTEVKVLIPHRENTQLEIKFMHSKPYLSSKYYQQNVLRVSTIKVLIVQ